MPVAVAALAVVGALLVDRLFGEPARWHPVVGMGRYLAWAGRHVAPAAAGAVPRDMAAFARGALAWSVGALVCTALAWYLQSWLLRLHPLAAALALGLALKPLLAWRMLRDETAAVEAALGRSLAEGRERLSRLVSRDTSALSESEVRESAIESLAENFNDSVIAPLFWFVVAGLPGAALYRFANTADAMWGYRGMRGGRCWEWAGKWTAHADDLLSWLPARLSAACLLLGAPVAAWRALPGEAARTPSPNGGWPMGAMALRLGVRLGKPGHYLLFGQGRVPEAADTAAALRCTAGIVAGLGMVALAIGLVRS